MLALRPAAASRPPAAAAATVTRPTSARPLPLLAAPWAEAIQLPTTKASRWHRHGPRARQSLAALAVVATVAMGFPKRVASLAWTEKKEGPASIPREREPLGATRLGAAEAPGPQEVQLGLAPPQWQARLPPPCSQSSEPNLLSHNLSVELRVCLPPVTAACRPPEIDNEPMRRPLTPRVLAHLGAVRPGAAARSARGRPPQRPLCPGWWP